MCSSVFESLARAVLLMNSAKLNDNTTEIALKIAHSSVVQPLYDSLR